MQASRSGFLLIVYFQNVSLKYVFGIVLNSQLFYFATKIYPDLPMSRRRNPLPTPKFLQRISDALRLDEQMQLQMDE